MAEANFIRAKARAIELLKQYGVDSPDFEIEDVAYALGVDIEHGGIENADAWLLRRENGTGVIRLNSKIISPERRRFSIAHELGHWILHPKMSQGHLCFATDLQDYRRSSEEAEANYFAASLLMPDHWIPRDIFKQDPQFALIKGLAKRFRTSLTASARRFVELSTQPLVLVSSNKGTIMWSVRSKSASDFFLPPGQSVAEDSLTATAVLSGANTGAMKLVDPQAWFPDRDFERDSELYEDAMYLKEFDIALTLLWILS